MFCFSPPDRVPVLVKLRVMGAVRSCVPTVGWVVTVEEVVVMCLLRCVVILVGHRCWGWWWRSVYNRTRVRPTVLVVVCWTVAGNYWCWCWCGSSIVKVVREAAIVVEAVVRVLGGRQGSSAQGEKQNSQLHGR